MQKKSFNNISEISHTRVQKQADHLSTMIYLQRMPLYIDVHKDLGKPKKDGKNLLTSTVIQEGTKYKAVLTALQDYEKYITMNYGNCST